MASCVQPAVDMFGMIMQLLCVLLEALCFGQAGLAHAGKPTPTCVGAALASRWRPDKVWHNQA
jgi:hypothetical protein